MINIGDNISELYVGSTEIAEAYVGSQLVYSKAPPPYDAVIEYLQSTGTQYIDIGLIPTNLTKTECVFSATFNNRRLYGAEGSSNQRYQAIVYGGDYGVIIRFGNKGNIYHKIDTSGIHTVIISKSRIYVDNWSTTNIPQSNFSALYNLILYGYNVNNTPSQLSSAAIYSFKLWENNVLMRDLIPVRVGTVGYMYDKVSKQMFGNNGTGDFILGADV